MQSKGYPVFIDVTPDRHIVSKRLVLKKPLIAILTPQFLNRIFIYYHPHWNLFARKIADKLNVVLRRFFEHIWFVPWITNLNLNTYSGGGVKFVRLYEEYKLLDNKSGVFLNYIDYFCRGDREAKILDLGCNCGLHLNFLFEKGYINLTGVDGSQFAIEAPPKLFPEAATVMMVATDFFQQLLYGSCYSNNKPRHWKIKSNKCICVSKVYFNLLLNRWKGSWFYVGGTLETLYHKFINFNT